MDVAVLWPGSVARDAQQLCAASPTGSDAGANASLGPTASSARGLRASPCRATRVASVRQRLRAGAGAAAIQRPRLSLGG